MATVLVTGAGGASGIGALTSLHTETEHQTVGVDMEPTAAGIHLADEGTSVPPANDPNWADTMAEIAEQFEVDVVIPTVDEELASLSSLVDALSADIPTVTPGKHVINTFLDKYDSYRYLQNSGHQVPKTCLGTDAESIESAMFPVIVKPRRGRGSRGVVKIADRPELNAHLSQTSYDPEQLIIQEYIEGVEYTTSVVGTKDGRLLAIVPKEAIRKNGSTTLGVTRSAPEVHASCSALFETVEPTGPMNVQQLIDEDGTPYTIEINPRFSSTSCLTVAAGINEFNLLIRDALGETVDCNGKYVSGQYIIRYDGHLFTDDVAQFG